MPQQFETVRVAAPAVPANNGTAVLFDSTKVFGGGKRMRMFGVGRVSMSFPGLDQASAANGLKGYVSSDGGTTWKAYAFTYSTVAGTGTLPVQVTADTSSTSFLADVGVALHDDVKFELTVGATAPTVWDPVIVYRTGDVHVSS